MTHNTREEEKAEQYAREFCRRTPRIKKESGVEFYERLNSTIFNILTTAAQEKEEAVRAERERVLHEIALHAPRLTAKKTKAYNEGLLSGWYACREFLFQLFREATPPKNISSNETTV